MIIIIIIIIICIRLSLILSIYISILFYLIKALVDNEDIKAANLASYSDGSLENDLPMQQLSELLNINHFIVSQVNPHSAIFSSNIATVWSNPIYTTIIGYVRFLTAQSKDWLKNIINLFIFRSIAPIWSTRRGFTQTLTQEYEG